MLFRITKITEVFSHGLRVSKAANKNVVFLLSQFHSCTSQVIHKIQAFSVILCFVFVIKINCSAMSPTDFATNTLFHIVIGRNKHKIYTHKKYLRAYIILKIPQTKQDTTSYTRSQAFVVKYNSNDYTRELHPRRGQCSMTIQYLGHWFMKSSSLHP